MSDLKFMRFIAKEIFPGGQVPSVDDIVEHSRNAGLSLGTTQLMNPHYVRTLDIWAANLQQHRDDAIATTSVEVYERYLRYLTGCADFFAAASQRLRSSHSPTSDERAQYAPNTKVTFVAAERKGRRDGGSAA